MANLKRTRRTLGLVVQNRFGIRWLFLCVVLASVPATAADNWLDWEQLPNLPNDLGVAGPLTGVHNNALIVAGGANFARPVWEDEKQWVDQIYVLVEPSESPIDSENAAPGSANLRWVDGGRLPQRRAYAACVSTPWGVVCLGGNNESSVSNDAILMRWDGKRVNIYNLPDLPIPNVYGQAAVVGSKIYLLAGQSGPELNSATTEVWSLDLTPISMSFADLTMVDSAGAINSARTVVSPVNSTAVNTTAVEWQRQQALPGPSRAFHMAAVQHNGYQICIYVMGGRRQEAGKTKFLDDLWEYEAAEDQWRRRSDLPHEMMAGTAIGFGQSHLFILGAATSENFDRVDELRDNHPGFPKQAYAYHTITDRWTPAGETPLCQVTTHAVLWNDAIVIPSGEVRPRVRTPQVFSITPVVRSGQFGTVNYVVLFAYLSAMVAVGFYFARRNNSTDQYFRGGQNIPWWAAGCSIFATMLSSLTYTGVPSKSYAQDWVYSIGNFMIPVVAVVAIYVALPFFRRIDATSAYEYLEKRFNRSVRLFGSLSFTLFHIFRMAVVMSLTGLALAVATPLTPAQSVLLMGALSIVYCTMGGIEAVIWTDTFQTVVLLGGAAIALVLLISGVDGGVSGFGTAAAEAGKFNAANFHWDATSGQIALWVILVGGIAQNLSSYTADQAVVQRYMTTSDQKLAARSIWTNAILTIPATLLFFAIGTALFAFYRSHPEKLDPTITTDQIFPLYIAKEMPIGLAGLLVAGIFSAAQSTVSTSMNSTATTIVTDMLRPIRLCRSERGYLNAARLCTLLLGLLGTSLALFFVDPSIRSLFDQFIKVIGLFMGVLGGLFMLGALTVRANGGGAMIGAVAGAVVMFSLWRYSPINGYLYTASGITACMVIGYSASFLFPSEKDLAGLTVYSWRDNRRLR